MSPKSYRLLTIFSAIFVAASVTLAVLALLHKTNDWNSVDVVKSRVSKHIVLPTDEEPALLTVTDNSKLTTAFLKQTQNGDKVLVYPQNKKAIIYRPAIDRIVDIGPVEIDQPQSERN